MVVVATWTSMNSGKEPVDASRSRVLGFLLTAITWLTSEFPLSYEMLNLNVTKTVDMLKKLRS